MNTLKITNWRRALMTKAAAFGAFMVAAGLVPTIVLGQVLLQPVVVEFAPRQKIVVVSVTLSEKAPAPIRLQAELLRWNQDAQGRTVTEASDDLLVSPPIADLQPGQRQVFRLAMRRPKPDRQETAYRLVLEDVTQAALDESGQPRAGINIRMRYDLPVLVAPAAKVIQSVQWRPCAPQAGSSAIVEACVRLHNSGSKRLKIQTVQFKGDGWQQTLNLGEAGLVLAGAEREWRAPFAAGNKGPLRDIQIETSRGESLHAEPSAL